MKGSKNMIYLELLRKGVEVLSKPVYKNDIHFCSAVKFLFIFNFLCFWRMLPL